MAETIKQMGERLAGDKPRNHTPLPKPQKQPFFIRDIAQERSLSRWRRDKTPVDIHTMAGVLHGAEILEIGVFTLYVRSGNEEFCVFKTGIVYVAGPSLPEQPGRIPSESVNKKPILTEVACG